MRYVLRMWVEEKRVLEFVGDPESCDNLFRGLVRYTDLPDHWSVVVTCEPLTWNRIGVHGESYIVDKYQHARGGPLVLLHRDN